MPSHYSYEPLSTQSGSIRLMRLLPGPSSASLASSSHRVNVQYELRCEIFETWLGDGTKYHALSYRWGADDKPYHIEVSGKLLPITASLHAALLSIQRCTSIQTLWVDAVCINQDDVSEKTRQVAQMGRTYKNASCVVSWLGLAEHGSELAMSWIRDFGGRSVSYRFDQFTDESQTSIRDLLDRFEAREGVAGQYSSAIRKVLESHQVDDDNGDDDENGHNESLTEEEEKEKERLLFLSRLYRSLFCAPKSGLPLGYTLEKILRRKYWRRAWIVQELFNAREIVFLCGRDMVDERSLSLSFRFLRILQDHRINRAGESLFPEFGSFKADDILEIRRHGRAGASLPLIYLLRHLRGFESKLRQDRLYSLLGIASDADELGIVPDYRSGAHESIVKAAQALLRKGRVEMLSLCNSIDRLPGVPSWVPDWGDLCHQAFLFQRHMRVELRATELQPKFDAATTLPLMLQSDFASPGQEALTLASIWIGNVGELGQEYDRSCSQRWVSDLLAFSRAVAEGETDSQECLYNACATAVADQHIRQGDRKPRADPLLLRRVCASLSAAWSTLENGKEDLLKRLRKDGFEDYGQQLWMVARNRKPMTVGDMYIGLAPRHARRGDEVRLVAGAQVPYIFRRHTYIVGEGRIGYRLVGEAYVHSIMDGEAVAADQTNLQLITVM